MTKDKSECQEIKEAAIEFWTWITWKAFHKNDTNSFYVEGKRNPLANVNFDRAAKQ